MRANKHTLKCSHGPDTCPASISLEIVGEHELRSVGQMLEDVAQLAGWQFYAGRQWCAEHGTAPRRLCSCSQRNGIKHDGECRLVKPPEPYR